MKGSSCPDELLNLRSMVGKVLDKGLVHLKDELKSLDERLTHLIMKSKT